ncbi:MAG: 23S rRNA (adenine(2030)-N(6))-methyltransferase RlmJ [Alphaproteobacteria bacterium]|nr:MAG: 23S rRNA (adenine(2030)-N(6))-methyltransferase RlmJ [Alphaproteobacteria bacterium]
MNYRHAFHAGNFADVVKHAVLARIIAHLKEKPAAFRVIDTHAGAGVYDLAGPEAARTGEWREGIGKLMTAELAPALRQLLSPYLDAVRALNGDALKIYPGSPALMQCWLRPQDRLIACEREPTAARALAARMRGDARVKAVEIDGYTALNAYVPPKERRGLVLIDPPFEQPDEPDRIAEGVAAVHRKWPTGIYALWYPIKDARESASFARRMARLGIARMLRAELTLPGKSDERLRGSGLILVNPPWKLEGELGVLLPALAAVLAGAAGQGATRIGWLTGET